MGLEPTTTGITILTLCYLAALIDADRIYINQQLRWHVLGLNPVHALIEIRQFSAKSLTSALTYLADVSPQGAPHGKDCIHRWPGIGVQVPARQETGFHVGRDSAGAGTEGNASRETRLRVPEQVPRQGHSYHHREPCRLEHPRRASEGTRTATPD